MIDMWNLHFRIENKVNRQIQRTSPCTLAQKTETFYQYHLFVFSNTFVTWRPVSTDCLIRSHDTLDITQRTNGSSQSHQIVQGDSDNNNTSVKREQQELARHQEYIGKTSAHININVNWKLFKVRGTRQNIKAATKNWSCIILPVVASWSFCHHDYQ